MSGARLPATIEESDKLGRKRMLVITLVLMGAATFCIGLLPGYDAVGVWAPVGLITLRLIQGFALGGEWAVVTATTSTAQFESWGWRIPFLLSAVLVLVGMYIRISIEESPVFQATQAAAAAQAGEAPVKLPVLQVLRDYRREVLLAIGMRVAENVSYYIFTAFILAYATQGFVFFTLLDTKSFPPSAPPR